MTLNKKKNTKKTRRKRSHYTRNNPNKRKRTVRRRRSNTRKNKKRKIKNQEGGGSPLSMLILIMILFYMIYSHYSSLGMRHDTSGKKVIIENINVGERVNLVSPESVGISLVPYNRHHYDVFMDFCSNTESLVVDLDESERIIGVEYYNNPYHVRNIDTAINSEQYLNDNDALIEYRKRWYEPTNRNYSYLSEGHLNVIFNALLPSVKLLTSGIIPRKCFISGSKVPVSQDPFFDNLWHQDYNPLGSHFSPQSTNKDMRVILVPQKRHGFKDTKLTMFSKKMGNIEPLSQHEISLGRVLVDPSLEPSMINIELDDQDDYLAIMFDNYKVFHRTPPVFFKEWLKMSGAREVYQIQIKWDDKDAYSSTEQPVILPELNKLAIKSIDESNIIEDRSSEILSSLSDLS